MGKFSVRKGKTNAKIAYFINNKWSGRVLNQISGGIKREALEDNTNSHLFFIAKILFL